MARLVVFVLALFFILYCFTFVQDVNSNEQQPPRSVQVNPFKDVRSSSVHDRSNHKSSRSERHQDDRSRESRDHYRGRDLRRDDHRDLRRDDHRDPRRDDHRDLRRDDHRDPRRDDHRDLRRDDHRDPRRDDHRDLRRDDHRDLRREDRPDSRREDRLDSRHQSHRDTPRSRDDLRRQLGQIGSNNPQSIGRPVSSSFLQPSTSQKANTGSTQKRRLDDSHHSSASKRHRDDPTRSGFIPKPKCDDTAVHVPDCNASDLQFKCRQLSCSNYQRQFTDPIGLKRDLAGFPKDFCNCRKSNYIFKKDYKGKCIEFSECQIADGPPQEELLLPEPNPLILTLQWPKVLPRIMKKNYDPVKIGQINHWTVHNLLRFDEEYLSCNEQNFTFNQEYLMALKDQTWPSFNTKGIKWHLAEYEWRKHGCKTGLRPVEYLETAKLNWKRYPIGSWLEKEGIVPNNTALYSITQLREALEMPGRFKREQYRIQCIDFKTMYVKRYATYQALHEIYICLTTDAQKLTTCPIVVFNRCLEYSGADVFYYFKGLYVLDGVRPVEPKKSQRH